MAHMLIFVLNFVSSFCICKRYSHFFSKNTCEVDIVLTRTINILTTNKLVKLRNSALNWSQYFLLEKSVVSEAMAQKTDSHSSETFTVCIHYLGECSTSGCNFTFYD